MSWFSTELLPALFDEFEDKLPKRDVLLSWATKTKDKQIIDWASKLKDMDLKHVKEYLHEMKKDASSTLTGEAMRKAVVSTIAKSILNKHGTSDNELYRQIDEIAMKLIERLSNDLESFSRMASQGVETQLSKQLHSALFGALKAGLGSDYFNDTVTLQTFKASFFAATLNARQKIVQQAIQLINSATPDQKVDLQQLHHTYLKSVTFDNDGEDGFTWSVEGYKPMWHQFPTKGNYVIHWKGLNNAKKNFIEKYISADRFEF